MATGSTDTLALFERNRLKARSTARICDVLSVLYAAVVIGLLVLIFVSYVRFRGLGRFEALFGAMPLVIAGLLGYGVLRWLGSSLTLLADISERAEGFDVSRDYDDGADRAGAT
ncbi:MAG TPA: hypothetical protein VK894_15450 [Jiangellales bacterium]|nr:hypothetical protein [Jiangellales bacterium]